MVVSQECFHMHTCLSHERGGSMFIEPEQVGGLEIEFYPYVEESVE